MVVLEVPHQEATASAHWSLMVVEVVAFSEDFQKEHPVGVQAVVEVHEEVGQEALVGPLGLKYHLVLEEVVVCLLLVA